MGTRKALLVPPHFNIVIRWIEAKKRVSFAETRHCGHMWTLLTTSTQFGHKPGTAHSTHQHSTAQGFDFLQGLPAVDYWCAPQCPLANRHWERGSYNLHITILHNITTFIGTLCVRHTDGFELRLLHNRNRWCAFLCKYFCNADDSDNFLILFATLYSHL